MTALRVNELEFGSLLTYTPRGDSPSADYAREFMIALKTEKFIEEKSGKAIPMSEWVANKIKKDAPNLPFMNFFHQNTILVPTPKSSLMKPDTLWIPKILSSALVKAGFGKEVQPCLIRASPVAKAATSLPWNRPLALEHYRSMRVVGNLSQPEEMVLIDDIITRGATFIGAANRLSKAFPETQIRAFAVMRTISNSDEFVRLNDPCIGNITLRSFGDTIRRP